MVIEMFITLCGSSVVCYLTTFALDDLGLQRFGHIVKSLDIKKIHTVRNSISDHNGIVALEITSNQ